MFGASTPCGGVWRWGSRLYLDAVGPGWVFGTGICVFYSLERLRYLHSFGAIESIIFKGCAYIRSEDIGDCGIEVLRKRLIHARHFSTFTHGIYSAAATIHARQILLHRHLSRTAKSYHTGIIQHRQDSRPANFHARHRLSRTARAFTHGKSLYTGTFHARHLSRATHLSTATPFTRGKIISYRHRFTPGTFQHRQTSVDKSSLNSHVPSYSPPSSNPSRPPCPIPRLSTTRPSLLGLGDVTSSSPHPIPTTSLRSADL